MASFNWPVNPTTFNAGPIQFEVNGVATTVEKDTGTPANSTPLPVEVLDSGVKVDFATETTLSSIDGKDFSTETTLSALNTKVTTVDTGDVTVSSSALPTGAATETTLQSILTDTASLDGKDFSTEATLSALNTKVTTVDTGDVTVSSSALPTGAATESTLQSILADTTSLDGKDFATQTTLSSQAADIGLLEDRLSGSLVPEAYDYIGLTYVTVGNGIGEIETATFKTGGSGGTTVATLTLAYDASDRLSSVTRS